MKVTANIIKAARLESEAQRRNIQGFLYGSTHVIRDVGKRNNDILWSKIGLPGKYDEDHQEMMDKIQEIKDEILAAHINRIIGA